jgi:pimeloyl-ACP methyl ester carboxylesterase
MSTPASRNPFKHLRTTDIRGIAQLVTQATQSVTQITEGVHQSVLSTLGIAGGKTQGQTRGITGVIYKSIQEVAQGVGKSTDFVLAGLQPLFESAEETRPGTPEREAILAALNGVIGDRLVASNNSFATPMTLRYRDEALNWQDLPPMPEVTGNVVLLIHGLCMNDFKRHAQHRGHEVEHGEALASALGATPVYLRYNSGLHTSENGRELSAQLEQLLTHWPTAIEQLTIVAHSMGGLIIRSAYHYARQEDLHWPEQLNNIVFLGTPHHGAPLEKAGNYLNIILGSTPYTRPFTTLGRLRSAGITDLRYGHVLDDDWQGHDRFHHKPDKRQLMPLPGEVACYTVAATLASRRSALADRLVGDGLVPLHSAMGHHDDEQRKLQFADDSQWIAYQMNHMELLNSPEVTRQIMRWLTPSLS